MLLPLLVVLWLCGPAIGSLANMKGVPKAPYLERLWHTICLQSRSLVVILMSRTTFMAKRFSVWLYSGTSKLCDPLDLKLKLLRSPLEVPHYTSPGMLSARRIEVPDGAFDHLIDHFSQGLNVWLDKRANAGSACFDESVRMIFLCITMIDRSTAER